MSESNSPERYAELAGFMYWYWMTVDAQKAMQFMRESLEIWRKLENPGEEAFTLSEISEPLLRVDGVFEFWDEWIATYIEYALDFEMD